MQQGWSIRMLTYYGSKLPSYIINKSTGSMTSNLPHPISCQSQSIFTQALSVFNTDQPVKANIAFCDRKQVLHKTISSHLKEVMECHTRVSCIISISHLDLIEILPIMTASLLLFQSQVNGQFGMQDKT